MCASSFLFQEVGQLKGSTQVTAKRRVASVDEYFTDVREWLSEKGSASSTGAPWHHLPSTYDLITHVLTRGPTIVDLGPDPKANFEKRRDIPAETLVSLAKIGAIIPDVYVRDETKWNVNGPDFDYLEQLFTARKDAAVKITMKGELVDAFLVSQDPDYPKHRGTFRELWQHLLHTNDTEADAVLSTVEQTSGPLRGETRSEKLDNALITVSSTHAYVAALLPDALDLLEEEIDARHLNKVVKLLYSFKRVHASPITAALGGKFYWTEQDARNAAYNKEIQLVHKVTDAALRKEIQELAANYLVMHVPAVPRKHRDSRIPELIATTGLMEINSALQEFENALSAFIVDGQPFEKSEIEWRRYINEREKILRKLEKAAGIALDIVIPVPVVAELTQADERAVKLVHKLTRKREHRLLSAANKVHEIAQAL